MALKIQGGMKLPINNPMPPVGQSKRQNVAFLENTENLKYGKI